MNLEALKEIVKSLTSMNIKALIAYEIISVFVMHLIFIVRLCIKEVTCRKIWKSYEKYGKESEIEIFKDRKALAIKECIINSKMKMLRYEDKFFGLSVLSMIPVLNIVTGITQGIGICLDIYKYNKNIRKVKEITCQQ